MANASKEVKPVVTTVMTEVVTLELTVAEAKALQAILNAVGGCPKTSPRKYIDEIRSSIASVGIDFPIGDDLFDSRASIYFLNDTIGRI